MDLYLIILCVVFFFTAFMYSTVGHGGASGYLAIMALSAIAPESMKTSALILNLVVSLVAFIYFLRKGYFKWKLFYPFAITSIPFAYLGSTIGIDPFYYKKILAFCLGIACIRIFGLINLNEQEEDKELPMIPALIAGAFIGLLSGMIGIGGGILLSPLILLMGWGKFKETACVSSLFIFANSMSGLLPIISKINQTNIYLPFLLSAIAGGFLGGWWGSSKAEPLTLKIALGIILLFASIKLIIV